uniref:Uncharacterized protein n=1 Tax=Pyxicephalus adspersus TaxID=30357 RepID=A0AAV3AZ11_PYXAD|nr:TPA: hypothetical protein GDO54_007974 [Pyxicephalus adspersus]
MLIPFRDPSGNISHQIWPPSVAIKYRILYWLIIGAAARECKFRVKGKHQQIPPIASENYKQQRFMFTIILKKKI